MGYRSRDMLSDDTGGELMAAARSVRRSSNSLDPCIDAAGSDEVLDVPVVTCEDHVAGVREERDRGIGDIARLGDRKQLAAASRRWRVERHLNRSAQRTGEAGLASRIAPHLRDGRRRGDRVDSGAPGLEQHGAESTIAPLDRDQRA